MTANSERFKETKLIWRVLLEISIIMFLSYAVLLMKEFIKSAVPGKSVTDALGDLALKNSLESPRPSQRLFVSRQLDFVSEIAASHEIGNPGDSHKIEDSVAQKQTNIRFRSKCTRKT